MGQQLQVNVNRDSLVPQAKVWDAQAQVMGDIAAEASSIAYSGNSGYFVEAVNAYNAARQDIALWCQEGQQEMRSIADVLVQAAQRYDTTEGTNAQNASDAVR